MQKRLIFLAQLSLQQKPAAKQLYKIKQLLREQALALSKLTESV